MKPDRSNRTRRRWSHTIDLTDGQTRHDVDFGNRNDWFTSTQRETAPRPSVAKPPRWGVFLGVAGIDVADSVIHVEYAIPR